ncbi:carboxylate--amine ligase [Candidatus Laterigemmans baculatus]|uniref:carboxylate--amine ligase n=1 Tax=Candidatus Laterigemmans baculatus TaxID=2770505 RepID=UPI0013DCA859|nr:carboxylate--amine ligase [Candidatus Laterigemmans baculatus]
MHTSHRESAEAVPAVVVGLDCITGLQTTRVLAHRGVPVIGVAEVARHFACRTRLCERKLFASTHSERLVDALEQIGHELEAAGRGRAVLVPCTDSSVLWISRSRERLQKHFRIALPSASVVEMMLDKKAFCEFAMAHDLPIPRTLFLASRKDAEQAASEMGFPCILKPPRKTPRWEEATKVKAFRVACRSELLELYDRCSAWAEILMVQEWIEGSDADLYSCNCYFDRQGQPQAVFTARKLRQWPPRTGTSCLGEACRNDELREVATRLFRAVDYRGLGYLEMKRDPRSGQQWIIEPNIGRPTGRSAIAEAGGVELLYTMYCDLVGLPLPAAREQTDGNAKWIYWRQDLRSAFYYWRQGELGLSEWLRSLAGRKATAVFSWTDPLPFCADWWSLVGKSLRRSRSENRPKLRGEVPPRGARGLPPQSEPAEVPIIAAGARGER